MNRRTLDVISVLLLAIFPFTPSVVCYGICVIFAIITVRLVVNREREQAGLHLFLLCLSIGWAVPAGPAWPWKILIPLAISVLVSLLILSRITFSTAFALGKVNRKLGCYGIAVSIATAVVLLIWFHFANPDVAWQVRRISGFSVPSLVFIGLGFALLNAALEEAIWRGVILSNLLKAGLGTVPALLLQAASFGTSHYWGMPSGTSGVILTFFYGLILGQARISSSGLLLPTLMHFAGDLIIFLFYALSR